MKNNGLLLKCSVESCTRKVVAKGLCSAHWQRSRKSSNGLRPEDAIGLKKGRFNPRWKGGQIILDGRVAIYAPHHPFPNVANLYVFRYRLILEKYLGRYLSPDEIVHHINGDVSDDRLENLSIMSQANHAKIHHLLRNRNQKGQFTK